MIGATRFLLIFFVFTLIPALASAEPPCPSGGAATVRDGQCWRTLEPSEKNLVIAGLWSGMAIVHETLAYGGKNTRLRNQKNFADIPEATTAADVVSYFDAFYTSPANRLISWREAYVLAALQANDDDSNDLQTAIRFFRDEQTLPRGGKWDGNIDGNRIEIRTRQGRVIVQLAGVADDTPEEDTQAHILNLMEVIKTADWRDNCDGESPEEIFVRLTYPYELFSADGHLVAEVDVGGDHVCVHGEMVAMPDLWGRSGFFDIGGLLLRRGLALPARLEDPKWPKERRNAFAHVTSQADEAKEKKLYIHGGAEDPMIALISRMDVASAF